MRQLPTELNNSMFLRYHPNNMKMMQACIFGVEDTPYAHGAFIYTLNIPNSYPQNPPSCLLDTTGGGSIRFNPNLYSCGKVCLSLLGTWRGNSNESWDPKHSTLYTLFISILAIVMCKDVLYNEPGYERMQGSIHG